MVDYRTAEIADVAGETARAARRAQRRCGTSRMPPACSTSTCPRSASISPSAAPTSSSTADRARRRSSTWPSICSDRVTQPIWGWFGQTDQFAMDNDRSIHATGHRPDAQRHARRARAHRARARASASPPRPGSARSPAKARALTQLRDRPRRPARASPRSRRAIRARRGGHVAIRHADARRLHAALTDRKVIVDNRDPDVLRLGLSPLTTRFVDVFDALCTLANSRTDVRRSIPDERPNRRPARHTGAMSVVKINAITIPEGMGPQLEGRFAGRAKMVEQFDGFEDFQLLRPTPNGGARAATSSTPAGRPRSTSRPG